MVGTAVERVAVLTGWGDGLGALPENAARAAAGRPVIPIPRPDLGGDRFRRATRECLLGIAAVDALLRDGGMSREAIRGTSTALIYATGGAYGASNAAFIAGSSSRVAVGDTRETRHGSSWAGVRAGETFACAPLIALALARNGGTMEPISVTGEWRGRRAGLHWE